MTETIQLDSQQQATWDKLSEIVDKLRDHKAKPIAQFDAALLESSQEDEETTSSWKKWFKPKPLSTQRVSKAKHNVYLWGDVGRGKTVLMRRFAKQLPQSNIVHFHAFMKTVHAGLKKFNNQSEPLFWVTQDLAKQYDILCLDEFLVSDIADAMILSKLLTFMQLHGVAIFTTSNFIPKELYKNGLQRAKFEPAIAHIESEFSVLHLDTDTDYRMDVSKLNEHFFVGEQGKAEFRKITQQHFGEAKAAEIPIQGRHIGTLGQTESMVWSSFEQLCNTARSQLDFIEIADRYETLFISDVPVMEDEQRDITRRFMVLIDVLYDKGTRLFVQADSPIDKLYNGLHWKFEFARTQSRLFEMTRQ